VSNRKAESRKPSTRKVKAEDGARLRKSARPDFRFVAGAALFGVITSLLLLLFLLEGPESAVRDQDGGTTVMEKTSVAAVRAKPEIVAERPAPAAALRPDPAAAEQPIGRLAAPALQEPSPQPQNQPVIEQSATRSAAPVAVPPPVPEPQPVTIPALPWQQETRPAGNPGAARATSPPPAETGRVRASLPSRSELKSWVKSNAREFVGGVDADGMPLYRFDLWVDAPEAMRAQVRRVSYAYLAPSAQPAEQSSSDATNGFRVKFGAASCAEKATVTLLLVDGRERKVTVDGCRILN
jgi:hypothetical protein